MDATEKILVYFLSLKLEMLKKELLSWTDPT